MADRLNLVEALGQAGAVGDPGLRGDSGRSHTCISQALRQRVNLRPERVLIHVVRSLHQAMNRRIQTRHVRREGRHRPRGCAVGAGEEQALLGETVEIRGRLAVIPHHPEVVRPQSVHHDEYHVGGGPGRGGDRCDGRS